MTYVILQYFQTKYNFHAVLREDQLIKLHGIFKPEKMKIRPSAVKLPEQLSLTWENVEIDNTGPQNGSFLDNIEEYQDNRFINIGGR